MFCTKCGAQVPDNTQFCTQCGAPLQKPTSPTVQGQTTASTKQTQAQTSASFATTAVPTVTAASSESAGYAPSSAPTIHPQQPAPKRNGGLIALVIILLIILIAIIILFVVKPFASDESSSASNNSANDAASSELASSSSQEPEPTVIARTLNGDVRIDMPKKYADLGYKWEYINNELHFQNKDDITAAIIYQGNYTLTYEEAVGNTYGLGTTIISGKTTPVNMEVFYWQKDSTGIGLIHGADPIGDGKPSLDFIGITPEEIASWVFLEQNESYHEAVISDRIVITESAPATPSSNNSPFYGVWIGAFSEEWRAELYSSEAHEKGLNPQIFISSEWTNLNPNTYWVVAAFVTPSQQIAERQLMSIQSLGYTNAYVKYSGDYKG